MVLFVAVQCPAMFIVLPGERESINAAMADFTLYQLDNVFSKLKDKNNGN
jgi:hypothetical protein